MTELWYENLGQFLPTKNQTNNEKNNALIRFTIYFTIIILFFNQDTRLLSISIIIILITFFIGKTEEFDSIDKINLDDNLDNNLNNNLNNKTCHNPTIDNPYMNYTVGDLINNPDRLAGCNNVKPLVRQAFSTRLFSDSSDIWGKFVSDRNFYTMPNTQIVNNQLGLANWCYGGSGKCKTSGTNCLKDRNPEYHRGRYSVV
jgi:hypothetical protein